jgi:hypothetical protein
MKLRQESSLFDDAFDDLKSSYELYNLCTKQYLGLGALLQWVPGTNANRARKQLSNDLEPQIKSLADRIGGRPAIREGELYGREFYGFKKYADLLPLYSYFNISFLFKLFEDIALGFNRSGMRINKKSPLIDIASTLPIISDIIWGSDGGKVIFQEDPLKNILHSILNPFRLIDDALSFLHSFNYRVLDIGSDRGEESSLPRLLMKGLVGVIFGIIKLPIKILKHAIDLPLNILKSFIVDPILHVGRSIKEACQNKIKDEKVLVATVKELHDVKELRQAAKGYQGQDMNYAIMGKKEGKKYINISKKELFNQTEDEEKLKKVVAVRGSSKKIDSMAQLLSTVALFSTPPQKAQNDPHAVEAAKAILSIK